MLDKFLDGLQNLAREDDNRGRAVAHFGVLRPRNVDEDLGGGMDDVEELLPGMPLEYFSEYAAREGTGSVASHTFITVAPSFVIVCLPLASTRSKSPPYGPNVDFMVA